MRVEPVPTSEEAAAIMSALEVLREEVSEEPGPSVKRDRWRLAGLLGHAPPSQMKLEGSLWSYRSWERIV